MKKIVLVSLLSLSFFAGRTQGVWSLTNSTGYDVDVTFQAYTIPGCTLAGNSVINPYFISGGMTPPGMIIPPVIWSPALPAGPYAFVAKVSYVGCPLGPVVHVGTGPCAVPHAVLPAACGFGPVTIDFPSTVFLVPTPPDFYDPLMNIY